jgi:acylphosphatase
MPRAAARLVIEGRVQGVGYRWWALEAARSLGLAGWVRNCRDGSVEAVVAGPRKALDQIIDLARKGPPSARVTAVDVAAGDGAFESFEAWATE